MENNGLMVSSVDFENLEISESYDRRATTRIDVTIYSDEGSTRLAMSLQEAQKFRDKLERIVQGEAGDKSTLRL